MTTGDRQMRPTRLAPLFIGAALSALVAGCASTETKSQIDQASKRAEELSQMAARPQAPVDVSNVKVKSDVYVGANVSRSDKGDPLPPKWDTATVTVAKAGSVSFQDIAAAITAQTGIPIAVGALTAGSAGQQGGLPPSTIGGSAPVPVSQPQQGGQPSMASGPVPPGFDVNAALSSLQQPQQQAPAAAVYARGGTVDVGLRGTMRLNYTGRLAGLLDLVAANYNVVWEYRDGRIVFQRYITRSFDVPSLPVIQSLSFTMASGSDAGSSGSGDSASGSNNGLQKAETKSAYDLWGNLQNVMKQLVGSDGYYQLVPETGQITIVAPPSTMRRVQDYVKTLNQHLSKQIAVSVKVYSVVLADGDDYNSDVQLLFRNAGKYGLSLASSGALPATGTLPAAGTPGGVGWAILDGSLNTQGNGIFKALSTRGDVSVVTSASVTTLNGVPVPLQVANTRGYAKQVTVTQATTAGTNPSTSITPGSVTTGFNLHIVPKILQNGNVLLQYGMNVSELVGKDNGFDTFSSNGSSIQLPNINQRNFIQQAVLSNASTLVLAGFEQVRASTQKTGPVLPALWPLGGSNTSNMRREILVVAITPTLVEAKGSSIGVPQPGALTIADSPATIIPRP